MASGSVVGHILEVMPPNANAAARSRRLGGSTPAESVLCYAFDGATAEYLDLKVMLRGYAGGGLTIDIIWAALTVTSGAARWEVAVRRIQDDAEDLDTSQTYDFNGVTDTTASAAGEVSYTTVTFTDGADMDSWANGELAIVRIRRDPANAGDTITEDAQLIGWCIRET